MPWCVLLCVSTMFCRGADSTSGTTMREETKEKKRFAREMRRHGWILDKTVVLVFLAEVKNSFVHPHCWLKIGANYDVPTCRSKVTWKVVLCFLRQSHQTAATFYRIFMTQKLFVGSMTQLTTPPYSLESLGRMGRRKCWDSIMRDYDSKMFVWLVPFYLWSYKFIYISSQ